LSYERLHPGQQPSDSTMLVIYAMTEHFENICSIVGSDEVWFNKGDKRYYTGSRHAPQARAVLPPNFQKCNV
jgi:hypothetical protein